MIIISKTHFLKYLCANTENNLICDALLIVSYDKFNVGSNTVTLHAISCYIHCIISKYSAVRVKHGQFYIQILTKDIP